MVKDILAANENAAPGQRELQVLKENFPACFAADGSFDFARFKEYLNSQIAVKNEGYELRFLGKNYARLLASEDTTTVIVPDEAHNAKPENRDSKNVYISGDNLDGLKHLLKSYSGKVKCIYIDPPYNTGSDDFVYKDNFNFTAEELAVRLSIDEEQAERILDLTRRGSASHSAWLMFIYARLLLARDLLSNDGVIFISIDDNEQANLKLLCDDIFGEDNFISTLIWEKKKKGSYLADAITNIKEYIHVYSKARNLFTGLIGEINNEEETYPCVNASNGRDIRIIPAGIKSNYSSSDFTMKAGEIISDTTMNLVLKSDLVIKDGFLAKDLRIEGNWRYGQDAMFEYAQKRELYITRDLYLRRIVHEPRSKGLKDLLLRLGEEDSGGYSLNFDNNNLQDGGWGSNEDADEEQRILLGQHSLMSYPKPVLLIMKLIASLHYQNFIACDFFSGSATTAEALLRLSSRGIHSRFIMVQIPEDLDALLSTQSGETKKQTENLITFLNSVHKQHTLDQLGIERIYRAAQKIREENPLFHGDLGFKHYTLKEPETQTLDKLENFEPDLTGDTTLLSEFGKPTVLETWLVRDGYGFGASVQELDFAGYKVYFIGKHLYLLESGLTEAVCKELLEKLETDGKFNPENIVIFGYSFGAFELDALRSNLKRVEQTKSLHVNVDIRY